MLNMRFLKDQSMIGVALDMLYFWNILHVKAKDDSWFEHTAQQAYHDVLLSMQRRNLIESYNVIDISVKVNGTWIKRSEFQDMDPNTPIFKKKGKSIPI